MEGLIVMALIGVVIIGVIIFQFCQKKSHEKNRNWSHDLFRQ